MVTQKLDPQATEAINNLPQPLAEKVLQFNFSPGSYLHPDQLTRDKNGPDVKLATYLLDQPRAQDRLSVIINSSLGLDDDQYFNFDTPLKQLALLDANDLIRVAKIATLLRYNECARRYIVGTKANRIANLVGQDGFEFALQTYDFDDPSAAKKPLDFESLLKRVQSEWIPVLHEWYDQLPNPVASRVRIKFSQKLFTNAKAPATGLHALTIAAEKFVPICLKKKN